jgi:hypothetical protein
MLLGALGTSFRLRSILLRLFSHSQRIRHYIPKGMENIFVPAFLAVATRIRRDPLREVLAM